jgi:hypothetical protein
MVPNPDRARALFEIRKGLAMSMEDMVRNPAKYNNADLQDYIRDFCRKHNLQFVVKPAKQQPNLLYLFVRDPITEPIDFSTDMINNPSCLGWIEKRTRPTS